MENHLHPAVEAVTRLFAAEALADPDAPRRREHRVVVVAGGTRVDIPSHASEMIVGLALGKLRAAFGSAYLEVDGTPALPGPHVIATPSSPDERPRDALSILKARRATAG